MIPDFSLVEAEIQKLEESADFKLTFDSVKQPFIVDRWRSPGTHSYSNPQLMRIEYLSKLRQATRESWAFLLVCKIKADAPRVTKKASSKFWQSKVCEHSRVHILQTGKAVAGSIEFGLGDEDFFNRWEKKWVQGQLQQTLGPREMFKFSEAKSNHLEGSVPYDAPKPDSSGVTRVFNEQLAEHLDELHREWNSTWKKTEANAPNIVKAFMGKAGGKEGAKFREKLRKFLKDVPGLLELSPQLMLECMQVDPRDLDELSKFLRRNKSDLMFVSLEDFDNTQKEAQVQKVMES